ncbi:MAG: hypothetical protein QNK19_01080, partial [Xanthomonadales bacterium]|nr:hypothetical protein [Xanthomonadales bacterium]
PELTMPPGTDITQVANLMATAPGHATFRVDDEAEEEETIIITAPRNIFYKPDEAPSATKQTETSPEKDDAPDHESPADVHTAACSIGDGSTLPETTNATLPAETDETVTLSRPGIFRRLLSFLFRRSRQPG